MTNPTSQKVVQELVGRITTLSRLLSRLSDPCKPIFTLLRKKKNLRWDVECTTAFEQLKKQLTHLPILSAPQPGEILHLYLFVSKYTINVVLFRDDESKKRLIYYVSKALLGPESRYAPLEQLVLALLLAAQKLHPYF